MVGRSEEKERVMRNVKKDKRYWSKLLRKNPNNLIKKRLWESKCGECSKCWETIYNYNNYNKSLNRPFKNLCNRCTYVKQKRSMKRKNTKIITNPILQEGIDYLNTCKVRIISFTTKQYLIMSKAQE